jgi:hypothetical protein
MHEIFISYRRIDTETSGGHLYSDLCRAFGGDAVFMDTRAGGIEWGADFEAALQRALENCEALIVLIGPQWLKCERKPGQRRIDAPDDWVRREIATALKLEKRVFPALFQGAAFPASDDLPEELRALNFHKKQAYPITERHWDGDEQELTQFLTAIPKLKTLYDMVISQSGISVLKELIRKDPVVNYKVRSSTQLIEAADREVDEIGKLKAIHDALHEIESKCLIPIRDKRGALDLDRARSKFTQKDDEIRQLLQDLASQQPSSNAALPKILEDDLKDLLADTAEAFKNEFEGRAATDHDRLSAMLIAALEELISGTMAPLSDAIDFAAGRFQLQTVCDFMTSVADPPGSALPASGGEFARLSAGANALNELRQLLDLRLQEHGLLQRLDATLREVLLGQRGPAGSGGIGTSTLFIDWRKIIRLRVRLSNEVAKDTNKEMQSSVAYIVGLEPDIETAIQEAKESEAINQLSYYFNEVGDLFRDADQKLKELCRDLRGTTAGLKEILLQFGVAANV